MLFSELYKIVVKRDDPPPGSAPEISLANITFERFQTFASENVPDFDGRVCVAGNEDVASKDHAGRERLMPHQRVQARSGFHLPHSYRRVQAAADHVRTVELQR